jgi:hypothetical protein
VTVEDAAQSRFGFSATTFDQIDSMAGALMPINFGNTSLQSNAIFTKTYIGHANATTSNSWTFKWTAPPASQGVSQVTVYAVGNAANGDFATSGDHIYTATKVLSPSNVGIAEQSLTSPVIWQAGAELYIQLDQTPVEQHTYRIYDLGGRVVDSGSLTDGSYANPQVIDLSSLSNGVYVVHLNGMAQTTAYKFHKR